MGPRAIIGVMFLALGGCQQPDTSRADRSGSDSGESVAETMPDLAVDGSITSEKKSNPAVEAASASKPTAISTASASISERSSATSIPIAKGVYVLEGASCSSPANAEFRVFDGGLSGSSTRDCRSENIKKDGNSYAFDRSCVDTYTSKRTVSRAMVRVKDSQHIIIAEEGESGQPFRLCSPSELPGFLKEKAG